MRVNHNVDSGCIRYDPKGYYTKMLSEKDTTGWTDIFALRIRRN